jgi:hypothetical protein
VIVGDFDTWELPAPTFDLVISATAFHWLDPATQMHPGPESAVLRRRAGTKSGSSMI